MLPSEPGVSAGSRPGEQMPPLHSGLPGASRGSAVRGCSAITGEKGKGRPQVQESRSLLLPPLFMGEETEAQGGVSLEMWPPSHVGSREPRSTQC